MKLLFREIDNSQLIIFRILFGLLVTAEAWGAIATGWVKETFIEPTFTFNFIGFNFTQNLLGNFMYVPFVIMGFLGILIATGTRYKLSTWLFVLLWGLVYLMQKSHYNNHYYLLWLIGFFMALSPANTYASVDVKMGWVSRQTSMLAYYRWIFIIQVFLVYTYAAIAKLYPGWMDGTFLSIRLNHSADWYAAHTNWSAWVHFLRQPWLAKSLSITGVAFDFLICPLMLSNYTRKWAFIGAFIFHIFNSITLHIGIFPYFALALFIFYYPPNQIQRLFFPSKKFIENRAASYLTPRKLYKWMTIVFVLYFLWQTLLPIRHWFIKGDVLWTEEGHRLSWRMMLRTRSGYAQFTIRDLATHQVEIINLNQYLTKHQLNDAQTKPDMIWQFAQHLKKVYQKQGKNIAVYVINSGISVNQSAYAPFVKTNIDLASEKWNYFGNQNWILNAPPEFNQP